MTIFDEVKISSFVALGRYSRIENERFCKTSALSLSKLSNKSVFALKCPATIFKIYSLKENQIFTVVNFFNLHHMI